MLCDTLRFHALILYFLLLFESSCRVTSEQSMYTDLLRATTGISTTLYALSVVLCWARVSHA